MRCPLYYRDSEDARLCAAYSVDGGRSWQPVELAVHLHSSLITCGGIIEWCEEGQTRYLLPGHCNSARHDPMGRCEQFLLESDNLIEWRLASYIPRPETVFMHEGNIAPGERAGELKMVARTAQSGSGGVALDPPLAYSSISDDSGRSWSLGQPEPELYNTVSKAYYGADSLGRHVYVYNSGPAWLRIELCYKVQDSRGHWGKERVFFDVDVHNSYPTLLEYAPGKFYAVWDSSHDAERHRTVIRFGKLELR